MGFVVVTGAAGALGGAVTRYLVARGDKVAGIDLARSAGALSAMQNALGAAFTPFVLDDKATVEAAIATTSKGPRPRTARVRRRG